MSKKKKKVAIATEQFTYKKTLYKKGSEFKGNEAEAEALINKKYLKWQS